MTIEGEASRDSTGVLASASCRSVCACFIFGAVGWGRRRALRQTADSAASAPAPISWTHFDVLQNRRARLSCWRWAKRSITKNCASCHGESGAGEGAAAPFLTSHPRNFTKGIFRFKTTPGGAPPTDPDLFRTVSLGLHATAMPPWRYLLTDEDRWAVLQYVKTLTAFKDHQPGQPVDIGQAPADITAERIARGKQLYDDAGCATCHGAEGYGDGQSADTLKDSFGNPIRPRNFHKAAEFDAATRCAISH